MDLSSTCAPPPSRASVAASSSSAACFVGNGPTSGRRRLPSGPRGASYLKNHPAVWPLLRSFGQFRPSGLRVLGSRQKQRCTDALTRRLLGTFPQRIYRLIRIKAVHAFPQLPDLAFQPGLKPGPVLALERAQVIDFALEFL